MYASINIHGGRFLQGAGLLSLLLVAALVLSGCSGGPSSRSTGDVVDDSVITAKVNSAIADDLGLGSAASINVDTHKGIVQLGGFVESEAIRSRAGAAAGGVTGVRRVENNLALK